MSVPLDRLYNFIRDVCDQDVVIYRFFPHGSKKIEDLGLLGPNFTHLEQNAVMVCHDQEPLNWQHYRDPQGGCLLRSHLANVASFRHLLLLHSEKNSKELDKFAQDRMFPVYYWSHALISLDWFRYAKFDPALKNFQLSNSKLFLIYQRAWSNTREYRLKFTELLLQKQLEKHSVIRFNPVDNGIHYKDYKFCNPLLSVSRTDFETVLPLNDHPSSASADYNSYDYANTRIEVVLETLFDDSRLHLTEKSLRPIACGQPFILAATPGSLEYLKSYGFKTFSPFINESYDQEPDPVARLVKITKEMKRIADMSESDKNQLFNNINSIAKHNQELFFSQVWHDYVVKELKDNYNLAIAKWKMLSQRRFMPVQPL